MKTIFNKQKITVEVIHAEFDSAEERVLNSCNELLNSLKITTEDKLESKASKLEALGFVNSEPVKQFKEFKDSRKKVEDKRTLTILIVDTIQELKVAHPHDMFITVDELERICNKYDLIHAPVANYIKDIPEQNVIDMSKRKELGDNHKCPILNIVKDITFFDDHTKEYQNFVKDLVLNKPYPHSDVTERNLMELCKNFKGIRGQKYYFRNATCEKTDKRGLFIAAPKSHFDLKGLSKKSKFGFFTVQEIVCKDPVVFEYCINNIVRIVTKWGTDDDKSYLDEGLINETLN